MKRYSSYKDSGVEWIGEIPKGWSVKKLKFFGEVTLGKMLTNDDKGGYFLKPYLRSVNIQTERVDVSDVKEMWFSERELEKYRLSKGDLLFNEGGDVGRTCIWDEELEECYIQNSVNRVRVNSSEKYILYHSILHHQTGYYNSVVDRVSIPHLTKEKLELIPFVIPPLSEQQQIVSYLDEKTSSIDTLIQSKQKKITLLKEKRTSLINQIVTKGLNPNVEMKDSGVEWIGEIPKGWSVKKLKFFGEVTLGKMLTNDDKGGYFLKPYLRSVNIQTERVDVSDVKEMWFSERELEKYRLSKGDLLFNEGGDVGRTCIWDEELEECYIQNSVNRVRVNSSEKYILYHSILHHQTGYYNSVVDRVSIPHLTKEKLELIPFVIPPLSEQQQIVEYLDRETELIDKTVSIEERKIELLKEYKQSLISEVITGKRKVVSDE
jgi:type I restriction enzyme, S subunit